MDNRYKVVEAVGRMVATMLDLSDSLLCPSHSDQSGFPDWQNSLILSTSEDTLCCICRAFLGKELVSFSD